MYVTIFSNNTSIIAFNDGSTTVTLSYQGIVNKIHKIDSKYLPDITNSIKLGNGLEINDDGEIIQTPLTANRVLVTNSKGEFQVSDVTATELKYLDNVTSNIQTQFDNTNKSLNKKPGIKVSGETFTIEGQTVTAATGAEIFNYSQNKATGSYSHAEGMNTTASGGYSHAEGGNNTTASGYYSHAEGENTTASGSSSHAEGENTTASGSSSHAEGKNTTASGRHSHAEGYKTNAIGSS